MLIQLRDGEPIRFGPDGSKGVVFDPRQGAVVVDVADVGEDALLIHDEARDAPSVAFALARLSPNMDEPTPMGVFRDVDRPIYGERNPIPDTPPGRQLISDLLLSGSTWTVN